MYIHKISACSRSCTRKMKTHSLTHSHSHLIFLAFLGTQQMCLCVSIWMFMLNTRTTENRIKFCFLISIDSGDIYASHTLVFFGVCVSVSLFLYFLPLSESVSFFLVFYHIFLLCHRIMCHNTSKCKWRKRTGHNLSRATAKHNTIQHNIKCYCFVDVLILSREENIVWEMSTWWNRMGCVYIYMCFTFGCLNVSCVMMWWFGGWPKWRRWVVWRWGHQTA